MKKLNLDDLKQEYIGKTFGMLTVLDVYKDPIKKRYFLKCQCTCGNICDKNLNKVISGHTNSCGCFKYSKEYSDKLKSFWQDNPDKIEEKINKYKSWCKENKDKLKERGIKHSNFYKENPNTIKAQTEKRKQTLKNDPNIQLNINNKLKQYWNDPTVKKEHSEKCKAYYKNNPDKAVNISERMTNYYKEHPEKRLELSEKIKQWCKYNPDKVLEQSELHKQWFIVNRQQVLQQGKNQSKIFKDKRANFLQQDSINSDLNVLLQLVHPSQLNDLLSGQIKGTDNILTKCPICNNYEEHLFNNVWRLSASKFRTGYPPMCSQCRCSITSSYLEDEIADFVSTFYDGECIKNDRTILDGKELDLYYPEKRIAIEFNGDYWHDENHKSNDYHYYKFIQCNKLGITLVSIFENYWYSYKDKIISYLKDLFNNKYNELSDINEYTINLNYPPINLDLSKYKILNRFYISHDKKVFTCGYASLLEHTKVDLHFLIETAEKYNLDYFINSNGDLEITDKQLCFHYADILSGELDSYDRWLDYHNKNIRCVFVYPNDLNHKSKVNVYRNILIYHCGFAKKIFARNTVVKKYKAKQLKKFFEDNNIQSYRSASIVYVLEDKKTSEQYMAYSIGHSYFGKGNYDCEIARGACKLGYSVIGGASKLWKYIINDNPDIKSIVYYCDRRQYDQRSISHLMDSATMKNLGKVYMLNGSVSYMNYWLNDVYIDDKLWHKAGDYTNREPNKHKLVSAEITKGNAITVMNPGSFTNVFVKTGYHLDGLKVVKD